MPISFAAGVLVTAQAVHPSVRLALGDIYTLSLAVNIQLLYDPQNTGHAKHNV